MNTDNGTGEKRYNHKWEGRGNHRFCERCGCRKDCTRMNPEYQLNGVTTFNAPSCIKSVRKKYPSKYGKMPKKPKNYNNYIKNLNNEIQS